MVHNSFLTGNNIFIIGQHMKEQFITFLEKETENDVLK